MASHSDSPPPPSPSNSLSQRLALTRLSAEIEVFLETTESVEIGKKCFFAFSRFSRSLKFDNFSNLLAWPQLIISALLAALLLVHGVFHLNSLFGAFFLIFVQLTTTLINYRLWRRRRLEFKWKLESTIAEMRSIAASQEVWQAANFPHFDLPVSPCMALQWTYRDGVLVNVPTCLLTTGDHIYVRPGAALPGACHLLNDAQRTFQMDECFIPSSFGDVMVANSVRLVTPVHPEVMVMDESPYVSLLKSIYPLRRPLPQLEWLRAYSSFILAVRLLIPTVFGVSFVISALRYGLDPQRSGTWADMFLFYPAVTVLPLLAPAFPVLWILWYLIGTFRVYSRMERCSSDPNESDAGDTLTESSLDSIQSTVKVRLPFLRQFVTSIIRDGDEFLFSTSAMYGLGAMTNFCCVDKKGILSWPNPSPEKVFFMTTKEPSVSADDGSDDSEPENYFEVLDLTHGSTEAFGVAFDDPRWTRFDANLKPLGLSVLLNTCNDATRNEYREFVDYLQLAAREDPLTLPVVNRRCLCMLPELIGFHHDMWNNHAHIESQHSLYRYIYRKTDFKKRKRFVVPLPNATAVMTRDAFANHFQMFAQGTTDLLLDLCIDAWNGVDLVPLASGDRKKILDFYHRSTLSCYCTAFTYRPLAKSPVTRGHVVVQIPPEGHSIYQHCIEDTEDESLDAESLFEFRDVPASSDPLRVYKDQVFLGMVSMQYKVKADVVAMIETLDRACIRFVYFSKENEYRSQEFGEELGLETGWNCHISLAKETLISDGSMEDDDVGGIGIGVGASELHWSQSAPVLTSGELEQVIMDPHLEMERKESVIYPALAEAMIANERTHMLEAVLEPTLSDEYLATFENRAKLPRGIGNVRPHIKQVDNVPLLVSLFTDCTPNSTQEMIAIMQEYDESVCCVGSCYNLHNLCLFAQSNIAISVEPLFPQICQKEPPIARPRCDSVLSPMELSQRLISLPCSHRCHRDQMVNLLPVIAEARHCVNQMKVAFSFAAVGSFQVTSLYLFSALLPLPPVVAISHVWMLIVFTIPVLSLSIMMTKVDPLVKNSAIGRNKHRLHRPVIREITIAFVTKFIPPTVVSLLLFHLLLYYSCVAVAGTCHWSAPSLLLPNSTAPHQFGGWMGDDEGQHSRLAFLQNLIFFFLTIIAILNASGYLYPFEQIWKQMPFRTTPFLLLSALVLAVHLGFIAVDMRLHHVDVAYFDAVPLAFWILLVGWPLVHVVLLAVVKHYEIKSEVRKEKHLKLEFGTKLGMNSPF